MLPFKRILCPIDFSEPSYMALKAAEELALQYSAELYVVHVVEKIPVLPALPTNPTIDIPFYQEKLEEAAKEALDVTVKERISKKLNVTPIIAHGYPAERILEITEKEEPDLIVIATHGETGFRHFIFGSVAEKVIRLSKYPVLTIRVLE